MVKLKTSNPSCFTQTWPPNLTCYALPCSFAINLGQASDKLNLPFSPRFSESIIVCNTRDGSSWGREQRENHRCFSPGSEVKSPITFETDKFNVTLPDGHQVTFPNRLGHSHLSYLSVRDGFQVSSSSLTEWAAPHPNKRPPAGIPCPEPSSESQQDQQLFGPGTQLC
ncbi:PREDICTED: galectin-2 [Propithecus coquereli]|uniref:galectin-2 n=1 Tax=Propithecus coquereli TaxID=379532 RepID=UPI00063F2D7F|nr:PREDICTED: galectin-2 [Propithecus coquereli]